MARALSVLPLGFRSGRLAIISTDVVRVSRTKRLPKGERAVLVRCDCGTEKYVTISQLKNGHTRSCGCVKNANLIAGYRQKKHQMEEST